MKRDGFSLTDLLVMLVLFVVVVLFSAAATLNLDNARARVKCASNLRQIGQAILLYSNDSRGPYPRTKYDSGTADQPTAYTGSDSTDPFSPACPQKNDVSAAIYDLLRTEDITSAVFVCPATGQKPYDFGGGTANALDKANFASGESLSYSYADPYPSEAARGLGYKLVQGLDPAFAVAADMNPGSPDLTRLTVSSSAADMQKGNSSNHSNEGQNVLYGDGHVEFVNNPFCGINRDNIYTYGKSGSDPVSQAPEPTGGTGIYGSPIGPADSVLLPAAIVPAANSVAPSAAAPVNAPAAGLPAAAVTPMDQGTDLTTVFVIASLIFLVILLTALAIVALRAKRARRAV